MNAVRWVDKPSETAEGLSTTASKSTGAGARPSVRLSANRNLKKTVDSRLTELMSINGTTVGTENGSSVAGQSRGYYD